MISSFGQPSTGWVWRDTIKTNPRVHCATYKQMVGVRAGDPVSSARDSFQFCYGYQEASFLQAAFPYCTACTLEPRFTRTLGRRPRLFLLARVLIVLHPTWFCVCQALWNKAGENSMHRNVILETARASSTCLCPQHSGGRARMIKSSKWWVQGEPRL